MRKTFIRPVNNSLPSFGSYYYHYFLNFPLIWHTFCLVISCRYQEAFESSLFTETDNPWAAFFGPCKAKRPYDTMMYEYNFQHDSFSRTSEIVSRTIHDDLIYQNQPFYTSVVLPFKVSAVGWDDWKSSERFSGKFFLFSCSFIVFFSFVVLCPFLNLTG